MCLLPWGVPTHTPPSGAPSPCGSLSSPHQAPLPQLWPQHEGGCWRPSFGEAVLQICPLLLSTYTGAARVLSSPLAGWFQKEGKKKRKKKKNYNKQTKNQTHAAVSASPSLERPSEEELEGAQG